MNEAPTAQGLTSQETGTSRFEINEALARRVLEIVDHGLVRGLGQPKPGMMCVEAAVNYALDQPHGDQPKCVGHAVRAFKIRLNDANWTSDEARTKGMRELAIAQLGSNEIDQKEFAKIVTFKACTVIAPTVIRWAAEKRNKPEWIKLAEDCEKAKTLEQGQTACRAAAAYAYAAAVAAAYAAAVAAYAAAGAAAYAAYAVADAAAYAAADAAVRDSWLNLTAQIGLDTLKQLNSPGCKFLFLAQREQGSEVRASQAPTDSQEQKE
jgi:hypothetical protein